MNEENFIKWMLSLMCKNGLHKGKIIGTEKIEYPVKQKWNKRLCSRCHKEFKREDDLLEVSTEKGSGKKYPYWFDYE